MATTTLDFQYGSQPVFTRAVGLAQASVFSADRRNAAIRLSGITAMHILPLPFSQTDLEDENPLHQQMFSASSNSRLRPLNATPVRLSTPENPTPFHKSDIVHYKWTQAEESFVLDEQGDKNCTYIYDKGEPDFAQQMMEPSEKDEEPIPNASAPKAPALELSTMESETYRMSFANVSYTHTVSKEGHLVKLPLINDSLPSTSEIPRHPLMDYTLLTPFGAISPGKPLVFGVPEYDALSKKGSICFSHPQNTEPASIIDPSNETNMCLNCVKRFRAIKLPTIYIPDVMKANKKHGSKFLFCKALAIQVQGNTVMGLIYVYNDHSIVKIPSTANFYFVKKTFQEADRIFRIARCIQVPRRNLKETPLEQQMFKFFKDTFAVPSKVNMASESLADTCESIASTVDDIANSVSSAQIHFNSTAETIDQSFKEFNQKWIPQYENIEKTLAEINKACSSVSGISGTTDSLLKNLYSSISNIATSFRENLSISSVFKFFVAVIFVVIFMYIGFYLARSMSYTILTTISSILFSTVNPVNAYIRWIALLPDSPYILDEQDKEFYEDQLEQQGPKIEESVEQATESVIVSLVNVVGNAFGSTDRKTVLEDAFRIKRIETYHKAFTLTKSVASYISSVTGHIVDEITEEIFGYPLYQGEKKKVYVKALEIYDVMNNHLRLSREDMMAFKKNKAFRSQVKQNVIVINEIKAQIVKLEMFTSQLGSFIRTSDQYNELFEHICAYEKTDESRFEPLCIQIDGKPGTGKTSLCQTLAKVLHAYCYNGKVPWTYNCIYQRKVDQKHWDGYDEQFCVMMDDFLQSTNIEDIRAKVLEIIYAVNSASYPLPMADLADKGKTYLKSELILLTSNGNAITPPNLGIQSNGAFMRRRDILVMVKNGQLKGEISLSNYRFDIVDPTDEQSLLFRNIGFSDLVKLCCLSIRDKREKQSKFLSMVSTFDASNFLSSIGIMPYEQQMEKNEETEKREDVKPVSAKKVASKPTIKLPYLTFAEIAKKRKGKKGKSKTFEELFDAGEIAQMKECEKLSLEVDKYLKKLVRDVKDPLMIQLETHFPEVIDAANTFFSHTTEIRRPAQFTPAYVRAVIFSHCTKTFDIPGACQAGLNQVLDQLHAYLSKEGEEPCCSLVKKMPKHLIDDCLADCDENPTPIAVNDDTLLQNAVRAQMKKQESESSDDYLTAEDKEVTPVDAYVSSKGLLKPKMEPNPTPSKADTELVQSLIFCGHRQYPETTAQEVPYNPLQSSQVADATPPIVIPPPRTTVATEVKEKINSVAKGFKDFCSSHIYTTACALALAIPVIVGVFTIFISSFKKEDPQSGSAPSGAVASGPQKSDANAEKTAKHVRASVVPKKITVKGDKKFGYKQHMAYDTNAEKINDVVKKNISTWSQGDIWQYCVFIKPGVLVTTRHFIKNLLEEPITMKYNGSVYTLDYRDIECYYAEEEDLGMIKITKNPRNLKLARDITKYFITDNDKANVLIGGAFLVGPEDVLRSASVTWKGTSSYRQSTSRNDYEMMDVNDTFSVPLPTKAGDCSKIYVANNPFISKKVFGIHIAGNSVRGVGVFLTQEKLKAFMEPNEMPSPTIEDIPDLQEQMEKCPLALSNDKPDFDCEFLKECSQVKFVAVVKREETMSFPNESGKRPTIFNGMSGFAEPEDEPTRLKPIQGKSPMRESLLKKLTVPPAVAEPADLHEMVDVLKDYIPHLLQPREYNLDEVLNRPYDNMYMRPPDLSTSRGYDKHLPLSLTGKKGKNPFVDYDKEINKYVLTPEYQPIFDELDETFPEQPKNHPHVIVDCVKDELLPAKKHYLKHTDGHIEWLMKYRIMGGQPFGYFLLEKMHLGAFYCNLMKWRETGGPIDLGINPYSTEWSRLIQESLLFGPEHTGYLAGDYASCDATIRDFVFDRLTEIINHWYGYDSISKKAQIVAEINRIMGKEVCHLAGNVFYIACGNPSGRLYTIIVNSITVLLTFMLAAWRKRNDMSDVVYVLKNIKTLGDDHILPIDKRNPLMTMHDVAAVAKEFGMTYTSVYKDKPLEDFYSLNEVKYLQRKFVFNDDLGYYVGQFPLEVIEQMLLWGSKILGDNDRAHFAVRNALYEYFLHGKQIFNDMKRKLNKILTENGIEPVILNYNHLRNSYLGWGVDPDPPLVQQMQKSEISSEKPAKTEQEDLTEFSDLTEYVDETESKPLRNPMLMKSNPLPKQGIDDVLSRAYGLPAVTWTSLQARGTLLAYYSFPKDALFPFIVDKLSSFNYFRAAVRISVRLTSTPFNAGSVIISWLPGNRFNDSTLTGPYADIYSMSCLEHIILSANSTKAESFVIPLTGTRMWWNMFFSSNSVGAQFGNMACRVLHPLSDGMNASTVTVKLNFTVNFENPEVSGFCSRPVTLEQQMEKSMEPKDDKKIASGGVSMEHEAELKSKTGLLSDIPMAVARTGFRLANLPLVGGIFSGIAYGASAFGKAAMRFGLNYPTNLQVAVRNTPVDNNPIHYSSGIFNGYKMSMSPENKISNVWETYCTDRDYSQFSSYCNIPAIIKVGSITASTAANTLIHEFPVHPKVCEYVFSGSFVKFYATPTGLVASKFKYWRGSMKFLFNFRCSSFVTARILIAWDPRIDNTDIPEDVRGDYATKIVEIKGDTTVEFCVPYIDQQPYKIESTYHSINYELNTGYSNGSLKLQLINPIYSSQSNGVEIYYDIWASGGEDLEFAYPVGQSLLESAIEPVSQQVGVNSRSDFKKTFEFPVPAKFVLMDEVVMGEKVHSWLSLMKRFHKATATTVPAFVTNPNSRHLSPWSGPSPPYSTDVLWWEFMRTFMYHRGSVRVTLRHIDSADQIYAVCLTDNDNGNQVVYEVASGGTGLAYWNTKLTKTYSFEIPFYSDLMMFHQQALGFEGTFPGFLIYNTIIGSSETNIDVYYAIGDDYTCGYPLPPQRIYYELEAKKNSNSKTKKKK